MQNRIKFEQANGITYISPYSVVAVSDDNSSYKSCEVITDTGASIYLLGIKAKEVIEKLDEFHKREKERYQVVCPTPLNHTKPLEV